MNSLDDDTSNYKNKLIVKLLKKYKIFNNNISLLEIRKLICWLIKEKEYDSLKSVLDILFEGNVNSILLLLLYYKNKIGISKKGIEKIMRIKHKTNLYINFYIQIDISVPPYDNTITPLQIVIEYFYEGIELFINYGADVNINNDGNNNALTTLCNLGSNFKKVKLLIDNNINIFLTDINENNALHILCKRSRDSTIDTFEYLISQGFNVNINKKNNEGNTPLIELSYNIYNTYLGEYISILMKYNADVNLVNNKGESAFFIACKMAQYGTAYTLIQYGADPYIKDNEGHSALRKFAKYLVTHENYYYREKTKLLDLLLELGFDINEIDENGKTALMELCYFDEGMAILFFIRKGANIHIKDKNGNTALSIAKSKGNMQAAHYIIKYGV